ncbi:MAG: tetratricopeptide repeat protein [Planctomycetota bacterium]
MSPELNKEPSQEIDVPPDWWMERAISAHRPITLGTLGGFEILGESNRGGQGVVHRAVQTSTGREVAIKRLRAGRLSSERERSRLLHEARLTATLDHPNIVTIYECCEVEGQHLLVMEWIRGEPLLEHAERRNLTVTDRVRLFIDICRAVEHAHHRGVFHRDLKPSNVLVDDAGRVKVIDFGLASFDPGRLDIPPMDTTEGLFLGTVAFAAPERVRDPGMPFDTCCDVYSLGAILHCLLGGLPSSSERNLIYQRCMDERSEYAWPSLASRLKRDLAVIIEKSLSLDPARRYQTSDQLLRDLSLYLDGKPVLAHPPSAWYSLRRFVRRHPIGAPVTAFAAAGLIALTTISVVFAAGERRERVRAELAESIAERRNKRYESVEAINTMIVESAMPDALGRFASIEDVIDRVASASVDDLDDLARARFDFVIGEIFTEFGRFRDARSRFRSSLRRFSSVDQSDLLPEEIHEANGSLLRSRYLLADSTLLEEDIEAHAGAALAALGDAHPVALQAMILHANVLLRDSNAPSALGIAERAHLASVGALGESHYLSHLAHITLIRATVHLSGPEEARESYRVILKRLRDELPSHHPLVLTAAFNLGLTCLNAEFLAEAEPLLRESYEKRSVLLGEDHPDTLVAQSTYASCLSSQGQHAEQLAVLLPCVDEMRVVFGPTHSRTLTAFNNLGLAYFYLREYKIAVRTFEQCLDLKQSVPGITQRSILSTRKNLALARSYLGEHVAAIEEFGSIEQVVTDSHGPDSSQALRARAMTAFALSRGGAFEEAAGIFEGVLKSREALLGPDHPRTYTVVLQMTDSMIETGRAEFIADRLRSALPMVRANAGATSTRATTFSRFLSRALVASGRNDEALEVLTDASAQWKVGRAESLPLWRLHTEIAALHHRNGEFIRAGAISAVSLFQFLRHDASTVDIDQSKAVLTDALIALITSMDMGRESGSSSQSGTGRNPSRISPVGN